MRIWQRLIQTIGVVTFVLSLWGFYWLVDGFCVNSFGLSASRKHPFFDKCSSP
jgi:hypothetical protein